MEPASGKLLVSVVFVVGQVIVPRTQHLEPAGTGSSI
jgi:hypothetical protein